MRIKQTPENLECYQLHHTCQVQTLLTFCTWKRNPSPALLRTICSLLSCLQMSSCFLSMMEGKAQTALVAIRLYPRCLLFATLCFWAFAEQTCRWKALQCSWGIHSRISPYLLARKNARQLQGGFISFGGRFDEERWQRHFNVVFGYRLDFLECFSGDTSIDFLITLAWRSMLLCNSECPLISSQFFSILCWTLRSWPRILTSGINDQAASRRKKSELRTYSSFFAPEGHCGSAMALDPGHWLLWGGPPVTPCLNNFFSCFFC